MKCVRFPAINYVNVVRNSGAIIFTTRACAYEPLEINENIYFVRSAKSLRRSSIFVVSVCGISIRTRVMRLVAHRCLPSDICMCVYVYIKVLSFCILQIKSQSSTESSVQFVNNFRQNFNLNSEINFWVSFTLAAPLTHLHTTSETISQRLRSHQPQFSYHGLLAVSQCRCCRLLSP